MIALDTNILVYAFEAGARRERAMQLLNDEAILSVQTLNEYAHSVRRKYGRPWKEIARDLDAIRETVGGVVPITDSDNRAALRIVQRYKLSFYDSLLLAVALEQRLERLYSQDMHHGLVIDDRLRIVDPFR